ncbi:MAG: sugar phosphate isomerase/epimerase [Tissierellia bacterium]|nr:sugar phosphate isomerase/epimerase [Tissierellia bacterium]
MQRSNIYISTIASDAPEVARQYGFGIEIAEFCTARYIDDYFSKMDRTVRNKLKQIERRLLHAPFNELFPCAIDPKARQLAAFRYRQAIDLAKQYNATKVVVHSGYTPGVYYPSWYVQQSILFWKDFLQDDSGIEIVLENVAETDPSWLIEIINGVNHPKLKLCMDIPHVNVYSDFPVVKWLEDSAPYISHFHIHNNDGKWDTHSPLDQGVLPMRDILERANHLCPEATYTLETTQARSSACWLEDNHFIEV